MSESDEKRPTPIRPEVIVPDPTPEQPSRRNLLKMALGIAGVVAGGTAFTKVAGDISNKLAENLNATPNSEPTPPKKTDLKSLPPLYPVKPTLSPAEAAKNQAEKELYQKIRENPQDFPFPDPTPTLKKPNAK